MPFSDLKYLKEVRLGSRSVYICDSHNYVLEAWLEYSKPRSGVEFRIPPVLITLDAHTDTRRAFTLSACNEIEDDIPDEQQVDLHGRPMIESLRRFEKEFIQKLAHDEHIHAAYLTCSISECFILFSGSNDAGLKWDWSKTLKLAIPFDETYEKTFRDAQDRIIESDILIRWIHSIESFYGQVLEEIDYILDLDLDFFRTRKSVKPGNPEQFLRLVRNASLITIAREPECVASGCLEGEKLTSDYVWKNVSKLITEA